MDSTLLSSYTRIVTEASLGSRSSMDLCRPLSDFSLVSLLPCLAACTASGLMLAPAATRHLVQHKLPNTSCLHESTSSLRT